MLGEAFKSRPNALNALRLVLASTVILWHTFALRGDAGTLSLPVHQLVEEVPVDGFFVISGFLIVRSWEQRPDLRAFARARSARILPGLWICLAVTAFVIAPLMAGGLHLVDQVRYVLGNAGLYETQRTIGPSPATIQPTWNSSLWTLFWEGCCYAVVAVAGWRGVMKARGVATFAFFCWAALLGWTFTGVWLSVSGTAFVSAIPRLGLDFALGALLWLLRDRIRFDGRLAASAAVLFAGSLFTPNYHLLGAVPLAYLCLWVGVTAGRARWLRWHNDLSYGVYVYGGPVQQSLILGGAAGFAWWQFTLLSWLLVLPLAGLSWFLVEKPALSWARRRRVARREPSLEPVQVTA